MPRPLPPQVGLNFGGDLGFGFAGSDFDEAVGLHSALFWRDPSVAFGGIAATYDRFDQVDRASLVAFAGTYLGDFDVMGSAGVEGGNGTDRAIFRAEAAWYSSARTRIGTEVIAGTNDKIEAEVHVDWQPQSEHSPLSLRLGIGGGDVNDDRFVTFSIGLTYHFAASKSLRKQLREDRLSLFD